MVKYVTPFLLLLLLGCTISTKKNKKYVYFGGKIINPKEKYVTLYNYKGVLDTLTIQKDYTFGGRLKNIKKGLYCFKHGTEFQYLFLEPNDSLLIRLNTWNFDESLVFSGTNSYRNNTLLEMYLQNEKDEQKFNSFYNLNYTDFKSKIDSLLGVKQNFLKQVKFKNKSITKDFYTILKIATTYPVYRKIESFFLYNTKTKKHINTPPKELFAYRNNIDMTLDSLYFFNSYNNILISQIYNDAYLENISKKYKDFTTALLINIDKKIKEPTLKNKLLQKVIIGHFYGKHITSINNISVNTFFKLCSNEQYKNKLKLLINDSEKLKKNDKLPFFNLVSTNGTSYNIFNIIKNKKAVIYFRNDKYSTDDWVASKINYFIKNNPNTLFLVINIKNSNIYIKKLGLKYQYYLTKNSEAHNFLTSEFSRIILVNKKGIVVNDFSGLSSDDINKQIEDFHKNKTL